MKRALCLNKIKIKKTLSLEHLKILKPQLGNQILSRNTHCTLHTAPFTALSPCYYYVLSLAFTKAWTLIENYQKSLYQYPQISLLHPNFTVPSHYQDTDSTTEKCIGQPTKSHLCIRAFVLSCQKCSSHIPTSPDSIL